MILFHGSDSIVKVPLYGYGKEDNDYGSGFYTTEDIKMANAWAVVNGKNTAYCNQYSFPIENMNVINLDEKGTLAWIAEVLYHRGTDSEDYRFLADALIDRYKVDTENCDVIIGYRADDSYMQVTEMFLRGYLSINEVDKFFREGDLGEQVCLKSKKAFEAIEFMDAQKVPPLPEYMNYDEYARRHVQKFLHEREYAVQVHRFQPEGLTIWDVADTNFIFDPSTGFYHSADSEVTSFDDTDYDDYGR